MPKCNYLCRIKSRGPSERLESVGTRVYHGHISLLYSKQEMPPKVSSHAVACVARDKCISHRIIVSMQYCRTEVAPQQERTCHRKKLAFEDGRLAVLRVQKLHHLFTETLGKMFEVGTISLKTTAPMPAKTFLSVSS